MTLRRGPGRANFRGNYSPADRPGIRAYFVQMAPSVSTGLFDLRSVAMSFPDPSRSATWMLGCAIGVAALAGAWSKQERLGFALQQSTLAAQTPATPAAPAD